MTSSGIDRLPGAERHYGSDVTSDKRPGAGEGSAPSLQMRIPQRPGINHARPDLQGDRSSTAPAAATKTDGVVQQRFSRADLNQYRRKAFQVGIERRHSWGAHLMAPAPNSFGPAQRGCAV